MKINKKTIAKQLASQLKMYSEMVDYCQFELKDDEKESAWRSKGHAIQDLAMIIFGVDEMCVYWRKDLIEKLDKLANGL